MNKAEASGYSAGRARAKASRFAKAEDATREEVEALVASGTLALERGARAQALRIIDRAARRAPDNFTIGAFLGRLLVACGRTEAALRHFEVMERRWPLPENTAGVIRALAQLGRFDDATARLGVALAHSAVITGGPLEAAARAVVEMAPQRLYGWVGLDPALILRGEVRGVAGSARAEIHAGTALIAAQTLSAGTDGKASFQLSLQGPLAAAIGARPLRVTIAGTVLAGSVTYPPPFALDGRAAIVAGRVQGWASLGWNPEQAPVLTARDERGHEHRLAVTSDPAQPFRWHFDIAPEDEGFTGDRLVIAALLPDGRQDPLPDAPLLLRVPPPLMASSQPKKRRRFRAGASSDPLVDVIVPVYRGKDETLACLDAVMATTHGEVEIVVVDDCSPEPALSAALTALAAKGAITLLRNDTNLGFPGSCNRALAVHPLRDAVLLNADAAPRGDWLTRLKSAAYSSPDIGTVTPFTNAGSIASYPAGIEQDCSAVAGDALARRAADVNRGVTVEVPVGVGFCLYVRRDCINEIGLLDADVFAAGYGEEVDFCLRAAARGWRHLLAADIFVLHAGGRSFGARRAALLERSQHIIDARYPEFRRQVESFFATGALVAARRRLDEAGLIATRERCVLLVTLALAGGVARFVKERCAAIRASGRLPIVLKPRFGEEGVVQLETEAGGANDLRYTMLAELGALRHLLERLPLDSVELHHFLDLDAAVIETVSDLPVPVDVYIHDYSWICPQITLIDETERYCGEPGLARCEECVAQNGSRLGGELSVAALRRRTGRWLDRAARVIVATDEVAQRLQRYVPEARLTVEPWEKASMPAPAVPRRGSRPRDPARKLRIALIGGIGVHKGYEILAACAADAVVRQLPLDFVVLGYTEDDDALMATGKVFVSGIYGEAELAELLDREKPDVVFFPSVWPEIWCYALSRALDFGRPILGFDIGAVGARLRGHPGASLLPVSTDAVTINNTLLEIGHGCWDSLPEADAKAPEAGAARSISMSALSAVSATVQMLPLADGLYSFSVREGKPSREASLENILLPAVQVGLGPGVSSDQVHFLSGPQTHGAWLCEPGDVVVARISGTVTIVLTSLQSPSGQALSIEVQKLDGRDAVSRASKSTQNAFPVEHPPAPAIARPVSRAESASRVPFQIRLHIRNLGDAAFVGADWAGRSGTGRWIEAFAVIPQQELTTADIEYKGLMATGLETPWLTNAVECGTRGKGTPLIGFAIRLRRTVTTPHYDCEYNGYFSSGTIVGPLKNGAPCRSPLKDDPLEGIQLRFVERTEDSLMTKDPPALQRMMGPRFSRLREEDDLAVPARDTDLAETEAASAPNESEAMIDKPLFELPGPPRSKQRRFGPLAGGKKRRRDEKPVQATGVKAEE